MHDSVSQESSHTPSMMTSGRSLTSLGTVQMPSSMSAAGSQRSVGFTPGPLRVQTSDLRRMRAIGAGMNSIGNSTSNPLWGASNSSLPSLARSQPTRPPRPQVRAPQVESSRSSSHVGGSVTVLRAVVRMRKNKSRG